MTTTPENGPEPTPNSAPAPDMTPTEALVVHEQPPSAGATAAGSAPAVAATAKSGNQTRTILEIVGGVVALGAVAVAGVIGFVFGYAVRDHGHDRDGVSLARAFGDDGPGRGGADQDDRGGWGRGMRPSLPFDSNDQGLGMGMRQGPGGDWGQGWGFGGQDGMPGFGSQDGMPGFGGQDGTAPSLPGPDTTAPDTTAPDSAPTAPDTTAPTAPGGS